MKLIYALLIVLSLMCQASVAQTTTNILPFSTAEAFLQNKLDRVEAKVTADLDSLNKRLDHSYNLFTYFASFAGALLTFLTIWNVIRDQRHHKDYREERKFYEERVQRIETTRREDYQKERQFYEQSAVAAEKRQSEGFILATESLKAANKRDADSAGVQLDNIGKLGGVISLVRDTFAMQLEREKAQGTLLKKLEENEAILGQLQAGYHQRYQEAADQLMGLATLKAMEWPTLSEEEQSLATRARNTLQSISPFVLETEKKRDAVRFAKIMQLAGISALYANDIAAAIQRLEEADAAAKDDQRPETALSRAYTKHFLGVAFKNWCVEGTPISTNIQRASQYLKDAYETVKEEKKEFLIPVTLAETLSYRSDSQEDAQQLLDQLIARLEALRLAESLDPDQSVLLPRCYLLKGNISYKAGDYQDAMTQNSKALTVNKNNHYALLSVLQCEFALGKRIDSDRWKQALQILDASGAQKKREITTRGTALAWGLVASATISDLERTDKFHRELDLIGRSIRNIAHKFPIFFSPTSKQLLMFSDLKQEMNEFVGKLSVLPKNAP